MDEKKIYYSIEIEDIDDGFFKSYIFDSYGLAFQTFIKQIQEEIKNQNGNCEEMCIYQEQDSKKDDLIRYTNQDRGFYIYLRKKTVLHSLQEEKNDQLQRL